MIAAFIKKVERKPGLTRDDVENVIVPIAISILCILAAPFAWKHWPEPIQMEPGTILVLERLTIIPVASIEEVIDAA